MKKVFFFFLNFKFKGIKWNIFNSLGVKNKIFNSLRTKKKLVKFMDQNNILANNSNPKVSKYNKLHL